ncbi:hypothetical protein WOLCODRAFT_86283, partial [Wolfiporia cocos MD-104 SS10]
SAHAGRFAVAVYMFKSLGVSSKGAGAAMKNIEILPDETGAPTVALHGPEAKAAANAKGITKVHISLSHSEVRYHTGNRGV